MKRLVKKDIIYRGDGKHKDTLVKADAELVLDFSHLPAARLRHYEQSGVLGNAPEEKPKAKPKRKSKAKA